MPLTWSISQGALPPGMQLDAQTGLLAGTPAAEGTYAFNARVVDAFGGFASRSYTFETRSDASATVVEFYNAALDHYFITWIAAEIAALDDGTVIKGWKRTGKAFATLTAARDDTSPICRFYIPPNLGNSHFFGRGTTECNGTAAANPTFVLEDPAFMHMVIPAAGAARRAPRRCIACSATAPTPITATRSSARCATTWSRTGGSPKATGRIAS